MLGSRSGNDTYLTRGHSIIICRRSSSRMGFVGENEGGSKTAHKDSVTSHVYNKAIYVCSEALKEDDTKEFDTKEVVIMEVDMKGGDMRQIDVKEGVMDEEDTKEAYVKKEDRKESQI
ncbi:hypothetical protein Tco_0274024 [Tanacetum coccineum]